jgi:hypothetical protein
MTNTFEQCVAALCQCSLEQFVGERKRLAAELKASGDKAGAKRVEKLVRPSVSAWAVNQLWWQERASFEALFESAGRLRAGDFGAMRAHREALEGLRARAAEMLRAGSHATSEVVLRRVGNTLAALAAAGGFEPDLPGALSADRDAPGFGATGLSDMLAAARPEAGSETSERAASTERSSQHELDAERERLEQERQRIEQQRAAVRAERQRLETDLQRAREDSATHARDVERLRTALAAGEQALERARAAAKEVEARLESLPSEAEDDFAGS